MNFLGKIVFYLLVVSNLVWGYSDRVYEVQSKLSDLGYSVGTIDGEIGNKTKRAIKKYQEENGLDNTGRITNELMNSLDMSLNSYNNSSNSNNENLSNNLKESKYQIGFLAAFPTFGLSLKMDYSEKMTIEAIVSPLGDFSLYAARVNYYLSKEKNYNTYAYGMAGLGSYEYSVTSESESIPIFGVGGGIELSWRDFLGNDFPDLYSTFELGFSYIDFEWYNYGGLSYGGGIYYKF